MTEQAENRHQSQTQSHHGHSPSEGAVFLVGPAYHCPPATAKVQERGRLQRLYASKNRNAGPVCCNLMVRPRPLFIALDA
jgi:hypothetical protein